MTQELEIAEMMQKQNYKGYVLVIAENHPHASKSGYCRLHRLIVESKIGRYLKPEEVVHHLDGDKTNNKIENLMLFPSNNAHISFENKIRRFGMTNPIKRQIENRWSELK